MARGDKDAVNYIPNTISTHHKTSNYPYSYTPSDRAPGLAALAKELDRILELIRDHPDGITARQITDVLNINSVARATRLCKILVNRSLATSGNRNDRSKPIYYTPINTDAQLH